MGIQLCAASRAAILRLVGDRRLQRLLDPFDRRLGGTQVLRFGMKLPTQVTASGDTMLALDQGLGSLVTLVAVAVVLAFSHLTFRFKETPLRSG